jgi:hypothetical protein
VGLHKGGVVKVFDRQRRQLLLSDCGYVGRLASGKVISSQWADPGRETSLGDDHVEVSGPFYQVSRPVMDPWRFMAFRLFSLVLGRIPRIATWLKALLVRVLIYRKSEVPLAFRRRVVFGDDQIEIEDELRRTRPLELRSLRQDDAFTTIHMGSSRYFVPHELAVSAAPLDAQQRAVDPSDLDAGAVRRRTLRLG